VRGEGGGMQVSKHPGSRQLIEKDDFADDDGALLHRS
jgi:hypothetical protein